MLSVPFICKGCEKKVWFIAGIDSEIFCRRCETAAWCTKCNQNPVYMTSKLCLTCLRDMYPVGRPCKRCGDPIAEGYPNRNKCCSECKHGKKKVKRKHKSTKSGFVYLVQSPTGTYKIGHTVNPDDRMRTFSVKLPFEVELLHTIRCHDRFSAEAKLHKSFADRRVRGEWFALTLRDVEYIKSISEM